MPSEPAALRELGGSGIRVSPVAMGCWPIAGMTSLNVEDSQSLATLEAALDAGINFFDTAFSYGPSGESETLIHRALGHRRREIVIATKCGLRWDAAGERELNARPATLREQIDESLRRLSTDCVELLYLHAPDPDTPIEESAGALEEIRLAGKTRTVGVSNLSVAEMERFQRECPITAAQPPYNLLQRQVEADILPWCRERGISVCVYWPLMKGLLAGKLPREHTFEPGDGRAKYPMFQGSEWQKNQDFLDVLRGIARRLERTVAQVAVNWTLHRPGVTVALCGAKRPEQIRESAGAMGWELDDSAREEIEAALRRRGTPIVRTAV